MSTTSQAPKLPISPQTWAGDRGGYYIVHEGAHLKVMGKHSVLVWNNVKSQRTILHAPGCALPETPINQGQGGLTKFHSMFAEIFRVPYRIHACVAVATPHQRDRWTHHTPGTVVTDREESESNNKDSVMYSLIHLE